MLQEMRFLCDSFYLFINSFLLMIIQDAKMWVKTRVSNQVEFVTLISTSLCVLLCEQKETLETNSVIKDKNPGFIDCIALMRDVSDFNPELI